MTTIRTAASQAPLYLRDATDIVMLLTLPERMRAGETPLSKGPAPVRTKARSASNAA
jgi:hypothetical protein